MAEPEAQRVNTQLLHRTRHLRNWFSGCVSNAVTSLESGGDVFLRTYVCVTICTLRDQQNYVTSRDESYGGFHFLINISSLQRLS